MTLEKIDSYTKVKQMDQLVGQISELVGEHEIEGDSNFDSIISTISERHGSLQAAIDSFKPKSSQKEKDSFRDAKYRAFFRIVETALLNPEPGVADAAAPIFEVIKPFELGILRKALAEESSDLNTIIRLLNTPEFRAKMAVIQGCELSFNQLVQAQNHFEQADRTWKVDQSAVEGDESPTEIRDTLYSVMNDRLITYLELMMVINPSTYEAFAKAVNAFVISNNSVVQGRKSDSSEEEE